MQQYYIQLFSPHGLIRFHNAEIGRDRDTGGQVKYVLELLEHLSAHPSVRKVDLFTRRVDDKKVSPAYAQSVEIVNDKARIIRLNCGGGLYKAKEQLWNHLDEFVDKTIRFIESENDFPDVVHGHYADGNYIASELSKIFDVAFLATGHSLGRNKKSILLKEGLSEEKIKDKFKLDKRIEVEEKTLQNADAVIVSTHHEIESQYSQYTNKAITNFKVLPPGINNSVFFPFYRIDIPGFTLSQEQELSLYRANAEIERFLFEPKKPLILSIGRADKRKNFETIINSYGLDKELQAMANLAIFAGVRKDITQMPIEEQEILTNLLLLMDKYDLYGKMAIPKKNDPIHEVPEIYRIAARKRGVFVNATPGENFGLTIIEASACGLPVVASPTGGPKEIIEQAENGFLVNVEDPAAISGAVKQVISDASVWERFSENGIRAGIESYSWTEHVEKYIKLIAGIINKRSSVSSSQKTGNPIGSRLVQSQVFFISDLDGTLVDGENTDGLKELTQWLNENNEVVFGISSGRNKKLTAEALKKYPLPSADIVICSVGTEIYYTEACIPDSGWEAHINHLWKKDELCDVLSKFPKMVIQEPEAQTPYKLSYYVDPEFGDDDLANMHAFLDDKKLRANIFITDNRFLDIVPIRAGKGNALRYLSYKWQTPLQQFIASGNGGNDISMLQGRPMGIVVGNHSPELNVLEGGHNIYFSEFPAAKGVLDGIAYYAVKKPIADILN